MMKLTKTGIGLLTRLYRSVLKKCLLINVGLFALATATFTTVSPNEAEAADSGVQKGDIDTYATHNTDLWQFWYDKYTRSTPRTNFLDIQVSATTASATSHPEYFHGSYFDLELALQDISSGRIFQSGAIGTHDIATGAITATELASNAVTSAKIASGAVTTAKIADNAVTTSEIASGAVTDTKIASGITASKITQTASERFVSDTEKSTWNAKTTLSEVREINDLNNYYTKYELGGKNEGKNAGNVPCHLEGLSTSERPVKIYSAKMRSENILSSLFVPMRSFLLRLRLASVTCPLNSPSLSFLLIKWPSPVVQKQHFEVVVVPPAPARGSR